MQFVNSILNSINRGKSLDGLVNNSTHLSQLSHGLLGNGNGNGNGGGIISKVLGLIHKAGLDTSDIKDLTLAALLLRLNSQLSGNDQTLVQQLLTKVEDLGMGTLEVGQLI
jgi:hypothetical protein